MINKKTISLFFTCLLTTTLTYATLYDDDSFTRRPMTIEERAWAVSIGDNCSGVLLTKDILMTAHHCNNPDYRKDKNAHKYGESLLPGKNKFKITEILEFSPVMGQDYQISRIRWISGEFPAGQKFIEEISINQDDIQTGRNFFSTKLYTLGIPKDKQNQPTYSFGFAKRYNLMKTTSTDMPMEIMFLDHNMGTYYGNSGGGIFIYNTHKLVGLVRGGHDPEYNSNGSVISNRENPDDWNWGNSISYIYKSSLVLKTIFPDGKNVFEGENQ